MPGADRKKISRCKPISSLSPPTHSTTLPFLLTLAHSLSAPSLELSSTKTTTQHPPPLKTLLSQTSGKAISSIRLFTISSSSFAPLFLFFPLLPVSTSTLTTVPCTIISPPSTNPLLDCCMCSSNSTRSTPTPAMPLKNFLRLSSVASIGRFATKRLLLISGVGSSPGLGASRRR